MWDLLFLLSGILCIVQNNEFSRTTGSTFLLISMLSVFSLFPQENYYLYSLTVFSFPLLIYKDKHIKTKNNLYMLFIILLFFLWETLNCVLYMSNNDLNLEVVNAVDSSLFAALLVANTKGGISGIYRYYNNIRRLHSTYYAKSIIHL